LRDLVQQARHREDADDQRRDQEYEQGAERLQHGTGVDGAGLGGARQQCDHRDGENILDNQDREHDLGEMLFLELEVLERLDGDRRRRDRQHRAEEHRVHDAPVERATDRVAERKHQHDARNGRDQRGRADPAQMAE
jgi:hypothetical protein